MNETDVPLPTPSTVKRSGAASVLAAATVALSVLFITLILVGNPSPTTQTRPGPEASPETFTAIGALVAPSASPPSATATASSPGDWPIVSPSPVVSPSPLASPSLVVDADHVATRVRVPALHIDLAVVPPARDRRSYPKCNVAMFLGGLSQPGENGATYLYAHARAGMFLPIYERAIQRRHGGPRSMIGLSVEVYTSDDLRYLYRIAEVRVHQTRLGDAARAKADELWLQTSEGPRGTRGKTQVRALAVGVSPASHRQAHPAARPITCQ